MRTNPEKQFLSNKSTMPVLVGNSFPLTLVRRA